MSKKKNFALDKHHVPKVRKEYMDADYVHKLDDTPKEQPDGSFISDREWYIKFSNEFNNASLDFKNLENNLHNTPELKKDCTDRNNARNRCMYGIAKANDLVSDSTRPENDTAYSDVGSTEYALVEYIDYKRRKEDS